jgi:methanogenic corrinoid protein MtbC1
MDFATGDRLRAAAHALAEATVALDYEERPFLSDRYGEAGCVNYRRDILHNVDYLSSAIDAEEPELFAGYIAWAKTLLLSRNVSTEDIAQGLRCFIRALRQHPNHKHFDVAEAYVARALEQLPSMPEEVPSFIDPEAPLAPLAQACLDAMLRLDRGGAMEALEQALSAGTSFLEIYGNVLPMVMREAGRLWQLNEISMAHEHYCAGVIQLISSRFYDRICSAGRAGRRSIVFACVEGETHELGARIAADVFDLSGWQTHFLGANLPARELVALLAKRPPNAVGLSITVPTNFKQLIMTIEAIRDSPATSQLPIMVGGFTLVRNARLAGIIGADYCAADVASALAWAEQSAGDSH